MKETSSLHCVCNDTNIACRFLKYSNRRILWPYTTTIASLSTTVAILLLLVPFASTSEIVAVLGTDNGYDQGGPDPVCWESQFEYNETSVTTTLLNQALWKKLNENGEVIGLLASCDPSTSLSASVLALDRENTIYTNDVYDFDIELRVKDPSNTTAFVRLQFCDALRYGFCNPIPQTMVETPLDVTITSDKRILVSKWVQVTLDENSSVMQSIRIPESISQGAYYVIVHAIIVSDNSLNLISRLDIAQPIDGEILYVVEPPILQEVTQSIKIVVGIAIGICSTYALGVMIFIVIHRKHAVMRLAQGSFLVAICAGCFMQIVCSFVILPTRGAYCRLVGVLILIPMTFVASCMVGRIWRVYQTLSNVNKFGRQQTHRRSFFNTTGDSVVYALTSIANLSVFTPRTHHGRNGALTRRKSVRQSFSAKQTAGLVLFLTMPQILLQVLTASLVDRDLVFSTDVTGGFQKRVCEERFRWVPMVGTAYVVFVCILAVGLAWIARDLPSAFCEKDQVYRAASVSILTTFVGISLSGLLNEPTTHPNLAVRI